VLLGGTLCKFFKKTVTNVKMTITRIMKTYTIFLTVLALMSTTPAFTQDLEFGKNSIRIETGYAFTGSGDLNGFCFYNEYFRSVGKKFKIAPGIGILTFFYDFLDNSSDYSILLMNANCISLDLTGYFYPVKLKKIDIETGLGLYIRDWHWIYATGPDVSFSVRGLTIPPDSHADIFINAPGYTVSLGALLKIKPRLGISVRGVYQNDINGDNTVTARVGVSIRLK